MYLLLIKSANIYLDNFLLHKIVKLRKRYSVRSRLPILII